MHRCNIPNLFNFPGLFHYKVAIALRDVDCNIPWPMIMLLLSKSEFVCTGVIYLTYLTSQGLFHYKVVIALRDVDCNIPWTMIMLLLSKSDSVCTNVIYLNYLTYQPYFITFPISYNSLCYAKRDYISIMSKGVVSLSC